MNADVEYKGCVCHRRKYLLQDKYYWIITHKGSGLPMDHMTYISLADCKKRIDNFHKAVDAL